MTIAIGPVKLGVEELPVATKRRLYTTGDKEGEKFFI